MPNTLKLLIPIGLGIAAAIINFVVLSSSTKPVKFVVAKKDIKKGEYFVDNVEEADVPVGMAGSLKEVAIMHADRGLLSGQRATRDISAGDIILYRDTAIKGSPPPDFRTASERAKPVPLDGHRIYGSSIGDNIWFVVPGFEKVEGRNERDAKYVGASQKLGPFRIIAIGEKTTTVSDEKGERYSYNSDSVTIAYDPASEDQAQKAMVDTLLAFLEAKEKDTSRKLKMLGVEFKPVEN